MWKKQRFAIFKTFSGKKLFTKKSVFLPEKQPTFTELLQNINGLSSYCTLTSKVWASLWIDVAALSWWQATRYQLFCNEWDTDESHANNTSTIEISWSDIFFLGEDRANAVGEAEPIDAELRFSDFAYQQQVGINTEQKKSPTEWPGISER